MTREEAIKEVEKVFEPAFANYIVEALTKGATVSDRKSTEQEPCEDAISRQAVLEQTYNWSKDEFLRTTDPFDYLRKRINDLPPVTPARPKSEWIPVSERLPNRDEYIRNNGLFIVSDGNRSYSEWYDIYDKQRFGEPTISGFHIDYAVTAWMPLPEPYKAESEGEE